MKNISSNINHRPIDFNKTIAPLAINNTKKIISGPSIVQNEIENFSFSETVLDEIKLKQWEKEHEFLNNLPNNKVPLFFQTDFDYIPFSEGTMFTSACGITCAAMVASYMKDELINPGDLGQDYNIRSIGNDKKMEKVLDDLNIKYEKTWDWNNEIIPALQNGQVVIALVTENSQWKMDHFIVLTGITKDGRILVNDPFQPNYNRSELKDGYKNGFYWNGEGFAGAWIIEDKEEYLTRQTTTLKEFTPQISE